MLGTQRDRRPVLPSLIAWPDTLAVPDPGPMGRVERCACGGYIVSIHADDWAYIAVQVRKHQATPQHQDWWAFHA